MQKPAEEKFFDPERWAIVPASDYAVGPSNGHACHTLSDAMKIFQAELPARMSNAMRRQRELEELKLFIAGTKSACVLKQTTAVSAVQNEVATLVGLLREYETRMVNSIKTQCAEFQAALGERALVVDDTAKKLTQSISRMSTEDAAGNEAVAMSLNAQAMETILSGMIQADHLVEESTALFSNFPDDITFQVQRMRDATALTPKLVTLNIEKSQLKGVPPLIIAKDIAINSNNSNNNAAGDGSPSSPGRKSGNNQQDTGIRRLLQLPGSEHVQGLYPRTAFGQALTKRPFASLLEFHKLLHAGCIRSLGAQLGSVAVNRCEFLSPLSDTPLRAGRDTYKVFTVCTAMTAEGSPRNLAQSVLHIAKEAAAASGGVAGTIVKLDTYRTVSQPFPILWFDFGPATSVRIERYVLFHGHEQTHCAVRNWRILGTNELPFPPGIVAASDDDTLHKIARDSRNAVNQRHQKAETPDAVLPDSCNVTVLDVRNREAALGVTPFGGVMFECCGANPDQHQAGGGGGMPSSDSTGSFNSGPTTPRSIQHSSPSARSQRDFFRYVGLQVIAPGAGGGYHIELSGVEFFGGLMTLGGQ